MNHVYGKVFLVGAGPGDPGLITVKGRRILEQADVVIYDFLANPAILDAAPEPARRIYVGKRHGEHLYPQDAINRMLVEEAQAGRLVVRLKGGDPFIFGRGGEEAQALAKAGIPFEVVPGVTAATAVAAYAGIPLTQRGVTASVTFLTGQEDPARPGTLVPWDELGRGRGTLVFFMGVKSLPGIVERLVAAGRPVSTPAAVIHWGTHPCQKTVTGSLGDIVQAVAQAEIHPPALIVVGDVVRLRDEINWFETLPLFGKRVLVTRARHQQGGLAESLHEQGADVVSVPALEIREPEHWQAVDDAIAHLFSYHWLVFTSANGVEMFFRRLGALGKDSRALAGIRIAVVGTETAKALAAYHVHADLVPSDMRAEGVAEALLAQNITDQRVLIAQADRARRVLVQMLVASGVAVDTVTLYRSVPPAPGTVDLNALLDGPPLDYATFTSSSAVKNLKSLLGDASFRRILENTRIAAIGPVTAQTLEELGLTVHVMPHSPSIAALVAALAEDVRHPSTRTRATGDLP